MACWSLTSHLLSSQPELYKAATQSDFLLAGAEGRLPKEKLGKWLAADRLYIHSYIRAAGQLLSSLDFPTYVDPFGKEDAAWETQLADWLIEALVAIRREERFFIDVSKRYGLSLEMLGPSSNDSVQQPTALERMQKIFADVTPHVSAHACGTSMSTPLLPWLEGAVTFWGTERVYLDAWSFAHAKAAERSRGSPADGHQDADGGALRKEFIPNWTSPEFVAFVERLGSIVDQAVQKVLDAAQAEVGKAEKIKSEILARVESRWRTLLEAERDFWPIMA